MIFFYSVACNFIIACKLIFFYDLHQYIANHETLDYYPYQWGIIPVFTSFCIIFFFCLLSFLGLHLQHMEVPRLGV